MIFGECERPALHGEFADGVDLVGAIGQADPIPRRAGQDRGGDDAPGPLADLARRIERQLARRRRGQIGVQREVARRRAQADIAGDDGPGRDQGLGVVHTDIAGRAEFGERSDPVCAVQTDGVQVGVSVDI